MSVRKASPSDKPVTAPEMPAPAPGSSCDLCGGVHQDLLFIARDRLFGIEGEFPLVRCQDCGLVFISPRPSFEEMGRYYPQEDYDLYSKAAGLTEKNMEQLGRLHGPRKGRIENYRRPGRLLDIGFGDGSFLYFMKETGWEVAGVDYNQQMVERAQEAGIDARQGQLEDAAFEVGSFDAVTLWGVLEHVQSPKETLAEIGRITGEKALLVIYTQNAAAPEARVLGTDWFIYEAPRHLYSFTPASLTRLLNAAGFRVSEIVFETPLYYCQMNWQYFKERRLGRKNDVVHAPTLVDRLAVKGLSLYRRLIDGGKWSSAMTVYAVKRLPDESCHSEERQQACHSEERQQACHSEERQQACHSEERQQACHSEERSDEESALPPHGKKQILRSAQDDRTGAMS